MERRANIVILTFLIQGLCNLDRIWIDLENSLQLAIDFIDAAGIRLEHMSIDDRYHGSQYTHLHKILRSQKPNLRPNVKVFRSAFNKSGTNDFS